MQRIEAVWEDMPWHTLKHIDEVIRRDVLQITSEAEKSDRPWTEEEDDYIIGTMWQAQHHPVCQPLTHQELIMDISETSREVPDAIELEELKEVEELAESGDSIALEQLESYKLQQTALARLATRSTLEVEARVIFHRNNDRLLSEWQREAELEQAMRQLVEDVAPQEHAYYASLSSEPAGP